MGSLPKSLVAVLVSALLLPATSSFAWGQRGHHAVCVVASRLVKNPELARYLAGRGDLLGHVCNLPDISWRNLADGAGKSGDQAHFLDPENLGLEPSKISTSLAELYANYQGKPSQRLGRNIDVASDLGTIWWRADQFSRRGVEFGKKAIELSQNTKPPTPPPAAGDITPVDQNIFDLIVSMGLLGHFVGDAAQPLHNSADYDGWDTGHGGLHSYYETRIVDALPLDLDAKVYEAALKINWTEKGHNLLERMRELSTVSNSDLAKVLELDKIESPSGADANGVRFPAKRPDADKVADGFSKLVITHLARAASLLALTWDEILSEAGGSSQAKVPFSRYRSYNYPLDTAFVGLDYVPVSTEPKK